MVPPNSWGPFNVEFSGLQRRRVSELGDKARQLGYSQQFAAEFGVIREKLETAPHDWGDPLPALKLNVYRGIHARIAVTYGVHDRLPVVFIRDFRPVLDHPLASG